MHDCKGSWSYCSARDFSISALVLFFNAEKRMYVPEGTHREGHQ